MSTRSASKYESLEVFIGSLLVGHRLEHATFLVCTQLWSSPFQKCLCIPAALAPPKPSKYHAFQLSYCSQSPQHDVLRCANGTMSSSRLANFLLLLLTRKSSQVSPRLSSNSSSLHCKSDILNCEPCSILGFGHKLWRLNRISYIQQWY